MKIVYKLEDNKVVEFDKEEKTHTFASLEEFIVEERELLETLYLNIMSYIEAIFVSPNATDNIKEELKDFTLSHFKKAFKNNKNQLTIRQLRKEERDIEKKSKEFGIMLFNDTKDFINTRIKQILKNKKTGGNMFKTLKEAKKFTAHLDSLANEIESLGEVSPEMRNHLAYRLDRLSELIEADSYNNEKRASVEKEANGVGQGAWLQDSDEPYMNTFGGTGALERDSDEPYMDEFKGDDHMEVINRKEPADIKDDGSKKPQPSDKIKEREPACVNKMKQASQIKDIVKAVLAEME